MIADSSQAGTVLPPVAEAQGKEERPASSEGARPASRQGEPRMTSLLGEYARLKREREACRNGGTAQLPSTSVCKHDAHRDAQLPSLSVH
eukprot:3243499-Rhodomonas_salina.1